MYMVIGKSTQDCVMMHHTMGLLICWEKNFEFQLTYDILLHSWLTLLRAKNSLQLLQHGEYIDHTCLSLWEE